MSSCFVGARVAVHDAEPSADVVREFGPAAVFLEVDAREEVLEVDADAHGQHGRKDGLELRARLVVLVRVVRAKERAPPDEADRVRGMAELGARQGQVLGVRLDVPVRLARAKVVGRAGGLEVHCDAEVVEHLEDHVAGVEV